MFQNTHSRPVALQIYNVSQCFGRAKLRVDASISVNLVGNRICVITVEFVTTREAQFAINADEQVVWLVIITCGPTCITYSFTMQTNFIQAIILKPRPLLNNIVGVLVQINL